MNKVIVKLENVSKSFDNKKYIIKNLSLDVYEGEFLTLLGPSGCGKTTILRIISGLENVTKGKVYIDGEDVTNLSATKREVNTIFQNLAIFPHMTTFENVAFGLKMKKVKLEKINKKVDDTLKLVELKGFEDRLPAQLSGGQQQRVAIARGIVMNPKVLLLDESLCSLDLKLKRSMQIELKKIQKKLGLTFIYVTHDQDEALTMSDRIVVINNGKIEQDDTPEKIYQNPKNVFVADFIGESNIFDAYIIAKDNNEMKLKINENITFTLPDNKYLKTSDKIKILIRPENIKVSKNELKGGIKSSIQDIVYDGAITKLFVITEDNLKIKANITGNVNFCNNDIIYLKIDNSDIAIIEENENDKH